ncbi:glycosyltransferase family 9 protein [Rubrobacter marinus]|uniref:glycosyltransferase family 9 protein n=1 Tax=Rubrobacter marinus TaxID=2653852 RepID=UPI00140E26B7|nr:glycosyltransferase family 9 protein [Rubrobacter marinus]
MVGRIAVFRGLYLGDLVASTPALRALRRGHPKAEISLVGLPWAVALAPHLAPEIDRFVPYPGAPGLDGGDDEAALAELVREMRGQDFDLAVNLHGRGPESTRLVASFGARRTAGFVGGGGEYPALDVSVPWDAEEHEARKLLLLVEAAGGLSDGEIPRLRVREEDRRRAGELLGRGFGEPLALLHPGASVPEKRWPAEGFALVARGLVREGYAVAVTGSEGEREISRRVCDLAPGAVDLSGKTDLPALIGLVSRADLLVSNDTGPAHLAYALGTPSVTVFGPSTDVGRWGPLERERHAVLLEDPISEVRAEAVLEAAGRLAPREQRVGV